MKKKAKVDWKRVWRAYDDWEAGALGPFLSEPTRRQKRSAIERTVEFVLSHKPKKVKGRKKN